jgi:hypothetical protein
VETLTEQVAESKSFLCAKCGLKKPVQNQGGTGYATNDANERVCYACCADVDREYLRSHDRISLYLSKDKTGHYEITNWPGTLRFSPYRVREGRHNIAGSRYDAWFSFEGAGWHGVQYGENTQIIHCRKAK